MRISDWSSDVCSSDLQVIAGTGALDVTVAAAAQRAGLTGLEFLSGIPGTVGGALRMNAGAYGSEVKDVLVSARAVDPQGQAHDLAATDLGLEYRHCGVPEGWVFTAAVFQARPGDPADITRAMLDIRDAREEPQPRRVRTGGSPFAHPHGPTGRAAGRGRGCTQV